ncbi:hypothetical protein D918_09514 [Trichuris suis]|nr:hypothetical protein D918_09514 [Trichuris suis]
MVFSAILWASVKRGFSMDSSLNFAKGVFSVAYVTVPNEEVAKKLARSLVEKKLAACVNVIPGLKSIYEWKGAIEEDSELLLMIKTRTSMIEELSAYVRANHPYSVAEVIALPCFGQMDDADSEYKAAEEYWKAIQPNVKGMLGGLDKLSGIDITGSRQFLDKVVAKLNLRKRYALDCGCGIGRVTKAVLSRVFAQIDMVDVTKEFLDASADYMGFRVNGKVVEKFCCGLQHFVPPANRYDLIWIQWVSGQLTDNDLKQFLLRCKSALSSDGGAIVLKENISSTEKPLFDELDHSVTRSRDYLLRLFGEVGLTVKFEAKQKKFPKDLFEVRSFCLV